MAWYKNGLPVALLVVTAGLSISMSVVRNAIALLVATKVTTYFKNFTTRKDDADARQ